MGRTKSPKIVKDIFTPKIEKVQKLLAKYLVLIRREDKMDLKSNRFAIWIAYL